MGEGELADSTKTWWLASQGLGAGCVGKHPGESKRSRLENDWPSGSICLLHRFCFDQVSSLCKLTWRAER